MNLNNACPICHGEGCHVSFAGKPCPRAPQLFVNGERVSEVQGLTLTPSVAHVFNERIERVKEVNELRRLFELPNGSKTKWQEGLK